MNKNPVSIVSVLLTMLIAVLTVLSRGTNVWAQGTAHGTLRIGETQTLLRYATQSVSGEENLFDSAKRDRIIVLSDNVIPPTVRAEDALGLGLVTRSGSFSFLKLRFNGRTLVNVTVGTPQHGGVVILPGKLFKSEMSSDTAGTLRLEPQQVEGLVIATSVTFAAELQKPVLNEGFRIKPTPEPTVTVAPVTTANISTKTATTLFIAAVMSKDEPQALELIKLGVDPNGADQNGVPVLSWAVMMCQPAVVEALVKAGANLAYERSPGVTILSEARACPAAAFVLKEAGAR
jgi:hypothetical protein